MQVTFVLGSVSRARVVGPIWDSGKQLQIFLAVSVHVLIIYAEATAYKQGWRIGTTCGDFSVVDQLILPSLAYDINQKIGSLVLIRLPCL